MEERTEHQSSTYINQNNMANATFLQMRLDMESVIDKVDKFLSNVRTILKYDPKKDSYYEQEVKLGDPIVNTKGRSILINIIYMRINHHVVQGNFKEEHFNNFIQRAREEITEQIIINCYEWNIAENNLNLVIDTLMAFIEPFMSRLIGNKERDSYMQQFQTKEVISNESRKNPFSNFAGGIK